MHQSSKNTLKYNHIVSLQNDHIETIENQTFLKGPDSKFTFFALYFKRLVDGPQILGKPEI